MGIIENLEDLNKKTNDKKIKLVAVSKAKPVELIIEAYNCGQKIFGENKVQELTAKYLRLKDYDIEWHMIGHLQRNKVKYIAPFVSMIHSVDSFKLLKEINKEALKNNRSINCLLQFHIATEDTKFGLNIDECKEIMKSDEFSELKNIKICGVMGMATFTDDEEKIRNEFKNLKNIFNSFKTDFFKDADFFKEISMGMTNDWQIAIEESATIIRIGSLIFGER